MKTVRFLILTGMSVLSLASPLTVCAQSNTQAPVVIVPHDDKDLYQDLKGAPPQVQTLIVSFDKTRDKYLAQQDLLLARISKAATPEERDRIRDLLQANRSAFLGTLKDFRGQLGDELTALKGKISHEEFLRIIDAAHDAASEGGVGHHRGH
jgi:hypothetical protein